MEYYNSIRKGGIIGDLLTVSKVTKIFRSQEKKAGIKNISFSVKEGEFLAIVGPSGCGKSTLLRCIAGFEKIDSGKIWLQGKQIKNPGPDRFMVFQGLDQLFPWLTVKENIIFALKSVNKKGDYNERTDYFIEMVGLSEYKDYYPYQLSGGMKQRVSIARALSVEPKLLLMDEPFGSLDAFSRKAMQGKLLEIWEKTKATILFVTHDLEEAIDISDRILVFMPGKLKCTLKNPLARPREREGASYSAFLAKLKNLFDIEQKEGIEDDKLVPKAGLAY